MCVCVCIVYACVCSDGGYGLVDGGVEKKGMADDMCVNVVVLCVCVCMRVCVREN